MKGIKDRITDNKIFKASLRPPFPDNMLVELTNACNHRCVFCPNRMKPRKIGEVNRDLLNRILNEAYSLGTRSLGFYTTGEPFMSRHLDEYIAMAKEIGFEYVYIDTNGALATPERVKPVIEAGLDSIKFSINAGSPDVYMMIHGRDDFEKVISNLRFVSDYRRKYGRPEKIYVSYVVTVQNQDGREKLRKLVGNLVDDIVFSNVGNHGGMLVEENQSMMVDKDVVIRKPPCSMVFNRFHTTWEGYLTACCIDHRNYLVVADLNHTSLEKAWHSELFIDLRRRHLTDNLAGTLCYNCLYNSNEPVASLLQP